MAPNFIFHSFILSVNSDYHIRGDKAHKFINSNNSHQERFFMHMWYIGNLCGLYTLQRIYIQCNFNTC